MKRSHHRISVTAAAAAAVAAQTYHMPLTYIGLLRNCSDLNLRSAIKYKQTHRLQRLDPQNGIVSAVGLYRCMLQLTLCKCEIFFWCNAYLVATLSMFFIVIYKSNI